MIEAWALEQGQALTVASYLTQWLHHTRGRVRVTTYEGYEGLIRIHAIPGPGSPCPALPPLHIQRVYAETLEPAGPLSAGTVLNLHLVLTQALGQAVRWGLLEQNPARGAQPPRPCRPEPRVVDPALASAILSLLPGTGVEAPAAIALSTGMRRGEILTLTWGDLDGPSPWPRCGGPFTPPPGAWRSPSPRRGAPAGRWPCPRCSGRTWSASAPTRRLAEPPAPPGRTWISWWTGGTGGRSTPTPYPPGGGSSCPAPGSPT